MPKLTIEIPEKLAKRAVDALCTAWGYPEEVVDADGKAVPNPVSRQDFIEAAIRRQIREITVQHEKRLAMDAAIAAADAATKDIEF